MVRDSFFSVFSNFIIKDISIPGIAPNRLYVFLFIQKNFIRSGFQGIKRVNSVFREKNVRIDLTSN